MIMGGGFKRDQIELESGTVHIQYRTPVPLHCDLCLREGGVCSMKDIPGEYCNDCLRRPRIGRAIWNRVKRLIE